MMIPYHLMKFVRNVESLKDTNNQSCISDEEQYHSTSLSYIPVEKNDFMDSDFFESCE